MVIIVSFLLLLSASTLCYWRNIFSASQEEVAKIFRILLSRALWPGGPEKGEAFFCSMKKSFPVLCGQRCEHTHCTQYTHLPILFTSVSPHPLHFRLYPTSPLPSLPILSTSVSTHPLHFRLYSSSPLPSLTLLFPLS